MNKIKLTIIMILIFIISLTSFIFADKIINNKSKETNTTPGNYYISEKVIFLGDEITKNYNLYAYFDQENLVNQGITSGTIPKVMENLNSAIMLSPKKVVIMIGVNDLINANGIDNSIKENYKNLIDAIRNRSPKTEIIIESLLPINSEKYSNLNKDITEFNNYIKSIADLYNLEYIDLWSIFNKKNNSTDSYAKDGINLNIKGYELITEALEKYLSK